MNITVRVALDEASPALARLTESAQRTAELNEHLGLRVREVTRDHLTEYGRSHLNSLGGRRTNYWGRAALDVAVPEALSISETAAWLYLTRPGLSRAFGDVTIVPGTKTPGVKYLAIPARAEAYGLKPREVPGLVVFWSGKGRAGGLAQAVSVPRKRTTAAGAKGTPYLAPGLVMFWFAEQATQQQDRSLLPSDVEWAGAARSGAVKFCDDVIRANKT